jgi:hypothetical protein
MHQHLQYLLDKCNNLCTTFNQLSVTTSNILLAVKTIATPDLSYSLPATTLGEKHLNKLSNKLAHTVLPKLGYNRHLDPTEATGYMGTKSFQLKRMVRTIQSQQDIQNT